MQSMLHRPTSAPAAATNGSANNNKVQVEQNQNDEESLEESLDSLHSSRSMESLDKLPPFSPLTPLGTPSKSTNRRLWRTSSRSSAAPGGGGSSKSITSDKNSSTTGKDVDNSNGKSKSFRMSTKLFSSSSPKRLFNSSTTTSAKISEKKEGEKAGSTMQSEGENNAQTTAPTTPSIPLSTISQQQQTSMLSPLTPITTSMNNNDTNVHVAASSNNSTPRTANNITKDGDEEDGATESLDHIHQPAIDEDEIQEEGAKSSDNDVELKSALDSLGRSVKELRCLSPTAASAKSSNNDDIVDSPNTEGYNEFLSLIGRNANAENVEQTSMTNESSEKAVVVDDNDTTENVKESNDCQCQWCPESILKLLRGCSNANNNRSAITDVPQQSQQQESCAQSDMESRNVNKIHQSIRSVRTDLTAIMEHAQMTPEHKELILSEVYVIQNSLDKISSVSMNSSVDKS